MPEVHHHPQSLGEDTAQIMAEHKLLKKVLAKLEASRDIRELSELLSELKSLLKSHFEREERADGILRDVRSHAPNKCDELAAILEEHDSLLARAEQLASDARACLEGPMARLYAGIQQLKHDLHDHEARESEIFLDAVYTDIGTAD